MIYRLNQKRFGEMFVSEVQATQFMANRFDYDCNHLAKG